MIIIVVNDHNSDDHLRNYGFLLSNNGWLLSPGYDINPIPKSSGLHLNINETDNRLDFSLALETIAYYRIDIKEVKDIIQNVCQVVKNWQTVATSIGIPKAEQHLMASCFDQTRDLSV